MDFKKLNNITGWIVFAIAMIIYAITAEPTTSLWDCGEFIAGAYKLQIVHPPGAPLFLMIGRMFTAFVPPESVAYMINFMSGLATAFSVLFLFWITTFMGKKVVGNPDNYSLGDTIAVLGAGVVAGLSATFATSIWFSAVEGEVYAMSLFFTALNFWAMTKWADEDGKGADRWLIFIAFMIGLSSGVHLLSLLTIPAMALVYYFKKFEPTIKGFIAALAVGAVILLGVQSIMIPKLPALMASFDVFFVNSLGMPFWSGAIFVILLLISAVIGGVFYTTQQNKHNLKLGVLAFGMILLGFSTNIMVVIRAHVNTPINMNAPKDVHTLLSYINRDQYGSRPLLRGEDFDAKPVGYTNDGIKYRKGDEKYENIGKKQGYEYNSKEMRWFPRLASHEDHHKRRYRQLLGKPTGKMTTADNLYFFFDYQIGWMYLRYFFWNFVGRQNDQQGFGGGDPRNGNWHSGIGFIDSSHTYDQSNLPDDYKNDRGRNAYYFLPLLFGLLGLIHHLKKDKKNALVVGLLFFFTGLAIIIFLNQPPIEPRERDYAFAGSIWAFCLWIGFGVLFIYDLLKEKTSKLIGAGIAVVLALTAPTIMAIQNWDDHDRSEIYAARDYAANFLNSVDENAIIFTQGDNDTYPLWYAQEVEGIRTDVRVVNLSLLAVDWYIDKLQRKENDSERLPLTLTADKYQASKRDYVPYFASDKVSQDKFYNAIEILNFITSDKSQNKAQASSGKLTNYVPTKNLYIPVDVNKAIKNGIIKEKDRSQAVDQLKFNINKGGLMKNDLLALDIISSHGWERPVYFAVTVSPDSYLGVGQYLQYDGMAYKLVPIKTKSESTLDRGRVDIDKLYDLFMNKFAYGNTENADIYLNPSYAPSISHLRTLAIRLSNELIQKGQKEKAVEVLDKYFAVMPDRSVPFDLYTVPLIRAYYDANGNAKVTPIAMKLVDKVEQELSFITSLPRQDQGWFEREKRDANVILSNLNNFGQRYGDKELENKTATVINTYGQ